MKKKVYVVSDSILSPLGQTTLENFHQVLEGNSGLREVYDPLLSDRPLYLGHFHSFPFSGNSSMTRFEQLAMASAQQALAQADIDPTSPRTAFFFSTTKGNIGLLDRENENDPRLSLFHAAQTIAAGVGFSNTPIVVSHACISGVMAILMARRYLERGLVDHAVITGVDVLSRFVVSGFQSLQAISPEPCRPFDRDRKGISLGEAAATLVLSTDASKVNGKPSVILSGGGLSNDANHISGPSRTGKELAWAIQQALTGSRLVPGDIDFVSVHGTATLYNDEMEANALHHVGMDNVPAHSLKGFFGHTLGAAGVLESVMSVQALLQDVLLPTQGFENLGVSKPVRVSSQPTSAKVRNALKTASGFGGCNAAIVFQKEERK